VAEVVEQRRAKRTWVLIGIVLAVVFVVSGLVLDRYQNRQRLSSYSDRLLLLSELRRNALRDYIDTVRTEITFWSSSGALLEQQRELKTQQGGAASRSGAVHDEFHALARLFVEERGYYDFFLIDPEGNVLYTVEKEPDFGTNLVHGPWKDTGLADVFRRAIGDANEPRVVFSDFARYPPSDDAPAMFGARAMVDSNDRVLGVLAMQLPTDRIRGIMHFKAGMGETGETYLVGRDLLMRSDSRFSSGSTILETRVDTDTVRRALDGESAVRFTDDYRDERVLSAYTFIDIDDVRWAVMAEVDEDEISAAGGERRSAFSGLLALLYALAMLSVWFVQAGAPGDGGLAVYDPPDFPDVGD